MMATHDPSNDAPRSHVPYVLLADAHVERAARCLEVLRSSRVGVLVTRDGAEAMRVIEQFGPPVLLIIDLSLPRRDAFAVIEAACAGDRSRTEVIAWSAVREQREYAANRLAGFRVRILRGEAPMAVISAAIEQALKPPDAGAAGGAAAPPTPEQLHELMTDLGEQAQSLSRAPGVAVYMRAPGSARFRASITWWSDTPIPHSPNYIPRVFDWIAETGEAVVLPNIAEQPRDEVPAAALEDGIEGLVAVPVLDAAGRVVGTICVFDTKPLAFADSDVEALRALGATAVTRGPAESPRQAPAARDTAVREEERAPSPAEPPAPPAEHPPALEPERAPAAAGPELPAALLDRQHGEFAVAREVARARREQRHLSMVLFDVSVTGATDEAAAQTSRARLQAQVQLQASAETLMKAIRQSDLPIRWNDHELLVVLPGLDVREARLVAERVRAALQAGGGYRVAVSGGVAELQSDESFGAALARATEKVRAACAAGHNRVA